MIYFGYECWHRIVVCICFNFVSAFSCFIMQFTLIFQIIRLDMKQNNLRTRKMIKVVKVNLLFNVTCTTELDNSEPDKVN